MAKVVKNQEKPIYQVHCTECGKIIDNKFFPLTELLKQYDMGQKYKKAVAEVVELLGIGALYGQTVLPEVPAFVDRDDNWNFEKPVFQQNALVQFSCGDNEVPVASLREVNLNIASMIAQFCMITGFDDIYPMLKLRKEMDDAGNASKEQQEQWKEYCDRLIWIPGVKTDGLSNQETRDQDLGEILTNVLIFAEQEAKVPGRRHFAPQKMLAGWRYREENGRKMPYSLVARGESLGTFDSRECCCDKCRKPQVWQMGAYPQKIIGILGTQSVGKTTYLMALADRIPGVKFENMTITHDSTDPQRNQVESEGGLLWLYRNGFTVGKTEAQKGTAPALTFLIKQERDSETVMYTLADIPGEAFDVKESKKFSRQMIDEITHKLKISDSLILMLNETYLYKNVQKETDLSEQITDENEVKKIKDPTEVLTYLSDYLSKPLSVAVVLTAADKLGDLRQLLGVAYDIRKIKPLVHSAKNNKYVYNAEMMNTASETVTGYIDNTFGNFMHNLKENRVPKGSVVSAFVVSSGTQCASGDNYQAGNFDKTEANARYWKMCEARFGVESPLLWLLGRDGLLEQGRADDYFNGYDEKTRRRILNEVN